MGAIGEPRREIHIPVTVPEPTEPVRAPEREPEPAPRPDQPDLTPVGS